MMSNTTRFEAAAMTPSSQGMPGRLKNARRSRSMGTQLHYPWRSGGVTSGGSIRRLFNGADGEVREARQGAARVGIQAVQQRVGPAHLRERLAGGVEDVAGTLQDDHERVPARGRVRAGEPDPLRPVREVLLRRGRAAATGLQAARSEGMILVVSCYELGRQPLSVASAVAALEREGFETDVQDVSIDKLSVAKVRAARLGAISAPMHTALQLRVRVAARVREENPSARIAFFGLYAMLNREHLLESHCDFVLGQAAHPLDALASG